MLTEQRRSSRLLIWDPRDPDVQVLQDMYRRGLFHVTQEMQEEDALAVLEYHLQQMQSPKLWAELDVNSLHAKECRRPDCRAEMEAICGGAE